MMKQNVKSYIDELHNLILGIQVTDGNFVTMSLEKAIFNVVELIISVRTNSGKVMAIGNGGSAAIAGHLQNDFCKAVGVRGLDFSQIPLLTALSNDHGYEYAYERSVELWADVGDLIIAISSSGQSKNILRAVKKADVRGCQIITLSGFSPDNPLRGMGDVNFYVSSLNYGFVEIAHSTISHCITDFTFSLLKDKKDSNS